MTNGSGVRNQLANGRRQSAGKTGTSDGNNESWFVGYTPQLVTAVWVGTPDDGNKRVMKNVTVGGQRYPVMHGASIAAPIWKGIMNRAHSGKDRLRFPEPSKKLTDGEMTSIPRVTGMTVDNAIRRLEEAGFTASVGGSIASSVEKGRVAATSPFGRAPKGSAITIFISEGQPSRSEPKPRETIVLPPPPGQDPDPTKPGKPPKPNG
jgi:membrane peptidoglycan carboxypeptidase